LVVEKHRQSRSTFVAMSTEEFLFRQFENKLKIFEILCMLRQRPVQSMPACF